MGQTARSTADTTSEHAAKLGAPHQRPRTNAPAASPSANNSVATTTMEGPAGVSQASEAARPPAVERAPMAAAPTRLRPGFSHSLDPKPPSHPRSADGPATRPAAPSGQEPEPRPAEAGRRRLTGMFCDPAGSTARSARLDLLIGRGRDRRVTNDPGPAPAVIHRHRNSD